MPQKLQCKVTEVTNHGDRVYSVYLKLDSPTPRFAPGQFLHLALDPYAPGDFWPDSRIFSIASAPTERDFLRITFAVKGQFTTRMESELYPGSEVWVKMPYGEFIVNFDNDVCLLAGGTGVTAFTAFLAGLPAENPHLLYIFYGARRPDLLVYQPLIKSIAAKCSNLHPYFLVEEGKAKDCIQGRIDLNQVWQTLPDPTVVTYYLSGPPNMLKNLSAGLADYCIPFDQIVTDTWE